MQTIGLLKQNVYTFNAQRNIYGTGHISSSSNDAKIFSTLNDSVLDTHCSLYKKIPKAKHFFFLGYDGLICYNTLRVSYAWKPFSGTLLPRTHLSRIQLSWAHLSWNNLSSSRSFQVDLGLQMCTLFSNDIKKTEASCICSADNRLCFYFICGTFADLLRFLINETEY